ncbi:MAG: 6-phosphofructokinase [Cryomorphaceae bacterium]|jgi:6-phosphofructokinase 1|nr:6-phosphofructokinase [Cryomorphaceae bacterium]MBT7739641.1 6-phosphofructokinase [Cryomorphaceae bacterium]
MADKVKKIAVLTSGGDAPGMNAAVRAVVRASVYNNIECYGVYKGFEGLITDDLVKLNARGVNNIVNKGGTILKSARCLEFRTKEGRIKAKKTLDKHGIGSLVVIGGNGSLTGGLLLEEEHGINVIGIPGTIDNDLVGTRCSLGYDTALNTAVNAIDKIRDTASSHNRLFFIEVMGKGSGHIALNAGIGAGAEEVLIPEQSMGLDRLLDSLKKSEKSGKSSSIIVVSEGDKIGDNVFSFSSYIEKNLPHYEIRVSILGHIQRGGTPSCFDRVLASRMGVYAVDCLIEQKSKIMVGIIDDKMITTPISKAINGGQSLDDDLVRVCDIISI